MCLVIFSGHSEHGDHPISTINCWQLCWDTTDDGWEVLPYPGLQPQLELQSILGKEGLWFH